MIFLEIILNENEENWNESTPTALYIINLISYAAQLRYYSYDHKNDIRRLLYFFAS